MAKIGNKTAKPSEPPEPGGERRPRTTRPRSRQPPRDTDDDDEDGDIATPKRDRYGNDDEPL